MKKVLAVIVALVMAFSLCVPSFAATTTAAAGGFDFATIAETIKGVIGGFLPSDTSLPDIDGVIGSIGDIIGDVIGGIGGGTDTTGGTGTSAAGRRICPAIFIRTQKVLCQPQSVSPYRKASSPLTTGLWIVFRKAFRQTHLPCSVKSVCATC